MDRYVVKHKTGWIACATWSLERAREWIANFDPSYYTDKTLRADDFVIIDRTNNKES